MKTANISTQFILGPTGIDRWVSISALVEDTSSQEPSDYVEASQAQKPYTVSGV